RPPAATPNARRKVSCLTEGTPARAVKSSFLLDLPAASREEEIMSSSLEEWVRGAKSALKKILMAILVAGWGIGWGIVALIGWAMGSAAVLGASLGALGLAALAGVGWRYAVVRRRKLLARSSLKARLELRGTSVAGELGALVDLFDLASRDVDQ